MVREPARVRRRRSTTQDHITDVSLDLFASRGFDEVSVDDVARAAGIARRTLFRYYSSKNAIRGETSTRTSTTSQPARRRARRRAPLGRRPEPGHRSDRHEHLTSLGRLTAADLSAAASVVDLAHGVVQQAVSRLSAAPEPESQQAVLYDVAHAAAGVEIARSLLDYGAKGDIESRLTSAFVADAAHDVSG